MVLKLNLDQLTRQGDFALQLDSGETVHVRTMTDPVQHELNKTARERLLLDSELVRVAMKKMARLKPRPEGQAWNRDDEPPDAERQADNATAADLERFAAKVAEMNLFVTQGSGHDEQVPLRREDESAVAFLRRAIIWREESAQKALQGFMERAKARMSSNAAESLQRLVHDSSAFQEQMERSRALMRATQSLPQSAERIEAQFQEMNAQFVAVQSLVSRIAQTSVEVSVTLATNAKAADTFNKRALYVAVTSLLATAIFSGWALFKSYQDSRELDQKVDAAATSVKSELRDLVGEVKGMRADTKAIPKPVPTLAPKPAPQPTPPKLNP